MKVFTVHEPPAPTEGSARFDRHAFVREGFSWAALFFPFLWLLWHRMWWVLLGWLAVAVATTLIAELIPGTEVAVGIFSVLFTLWFALEANELRRWSLEQKGWRMVGIAAGRDLVEAEQSFFRRQEHARPAVGPARVPSVNAGLAVRTVGVGEPVIGVFPHAN
jgi:hypothetical protein